MRNDSSYGWLFVLSNKKIDNKLQVHCSFVHPDDVVKRLKDVYPYSSYSIEYKIYLLDPFSLQEKIEKSLCYCISKQLYDCHLSDITLIINKELQEKVSNQGGIHHLVTTNPDFRKGIDKQMGVIKQLEKGLL